MTTRLLVKKCPDMPNAQFVEDNVAYWLKYYDKWWWRKNQDAGAMLMLVSDEKVEHFILDIPDMPSKITIFAGMKMMIRDRPDIHTAVWLSEAWRTDKDWLQAPSASPNREEIFLVHVEGRNHYKEYRAYPFKHGPKRKWVEHHNFQVSNEQQGHVTGWFEKE